MSENADKETNADSGKEAVGEKEQREATPQSENVTFGSNLQIEEDEGEFHVANELLEASSVQENDKDESIV